VNNKKDNVLARLSFTLQSSFSVWNLSNRHTHTFGKTPQYRTGTRAHFFLFHILIGTKKEGDDSRMGCCKKKCHNCEDHHHSKCSCKKKCHKCDDCNPCHEKKHHCKDRCDNDYRIIIF